MLIAQRPTLSEDVVADNRSRFVIEPLEPGFGYTLGNSLRRTLLSSIPGASVTSIRIDGVLHEFSTIPGVKEDVTEIILNIKQLVVSSEHDEPVVMYLRKQGAGAVTAADIAPPAGVEVHNPDLHIATLNGKGKIEMELTVERGRSTPTRRAILWIPLFTGGLEQYRSGRVPEVCLGAPVPGLRAGGDVLVGVRAPRTGAGYCSSSLVRLAKAARSCWDRAHAGPDGGAAQPWRCLWRRFSQITMTRP